MSALGQKRTSAASFDHLVLAARRDGFGPPCRRADILLPLRVQASSGAAERRNHYFVLSLFRSFSVLAVALPARYPASYSADKLLYDQSSTFGQLLWLICF